MLMLNWDDNKYNIIQLENQGKISPIQIVKGSFSLFCGLQAHEGVLQMDEMTETEDDQRGIGMVKLTFCLSVVLQCTQKHTLYIVACFSTL